MDNKKRIEIKKQPATPTNRERLLDLLINDSATPFFRDENGDIHLYLDPDGGWVLRLCKNGTWTLE